MTKPQTTVRTEVLPRVGVDLHLELHGPRLREGLTDALRAAVRSGRLVPGTRLPASRALADDLGIARSTVTECYTALIEEGWLTARHGSGTRVAERAKPLRNPAQNGRTGSRRPSAHGLGPGVADYAEFPRAPWLAAARRAFAAAPHTAFGYGDPLGWWELRKTLSDYLSRVRGVYADPGQIVITSGFHHGLSVIARALKAHAIDTVAVEGYGLDIYRAVLRDEEMNIPPLRVDENGARVQDLTYLAGVNAVLLTPAHQFPTGFALSTDRRSAVLDWARRSGGMILEDDYDGEFRYDRKPVGALQGLDPDHVVYFGTASKSIAPALRLAWMVVPEYLLSAVTEAKGRVDTVSVLDQLIFTEFMKSGAFDRHVRGRRQNYRRRRDELIEAIEESASNVRVAGMAAGLQAVLTLPKGTEARVLQAAARQGLIVGGLGEFRHPSVDVHQPWSDALVVNFSAVSDSAWPGALRTLRSILP
ncbi:GntR family transcriptional regulator/MocR family aminotransferase [Antricoccus suffuscus]|uniref:GntR family transcriptional regulator/MocR family aminotransferase n=1 Tax=Antricoccus suffuscus TaxID=1629062 RepID=A0A2T0ZTG0_9ACTN|nr:PLP-dependent aminotransferase family protein [Antricoccus suffuscus]PRZ39642.1 GntR family transcriptional regulator/MocR family aminotransferase [Antricoccus suffuscus]